MDSRKLAKNVRAGNHRKTIRHLQYCRLFIYTVKFADPLESHTFSLGVLYDNEYRKLQHKYGFRWG